MMSIEICHGQNGFTVQPTTFDVIQPPKVIISKLVYEICLEEV